jgi:hypothetical protein
MDGGGIGAVRRTRRLVLWFRRRLSDRSGFFGRNPELVGHSHQIDQRLRSHLSHDLAAMDLHSHLAQLELTSNLLVQESCDDDWQDFSFARRQRIEALPQLGDKLVLLTSNAIARDARLNGIEQFLLVHGFGQKLNGAGFDRFHRHRNIAVTAEEYNGKLDAGFRQGALKFQSTRSRQPDVKHDTARRTGALALKKLLR